VYRRCQYIAVSRATRAELQTLRVAGDRVAVVHNGTEPAPVVEVGRSATPTLCVVCRLVPHKRVEHAIATAAELREEFPDLRLHVVGSGWWEQDLKKYAGTVGATELVTFEGQVSELRKHEIYAESWVQLLPSLKEGWGLVVGEAGSHGVPTVAYAAAGGTGESILHGRSGLLVDDPSRFSEAVGSLLRDGAQRRHLGEGAREHSQHMSWPRSQVVFATVLSEVLGGRRVGVEDPVSAQPTPGASTA
jgi:glycosyltransferase involved in cell wall biosynthesis